MKKFLLPVLIVLICSLPAIAQDDMSHARWQAATMIPDGNDGEWRKPLNFYDDGTALLFSISNDSSNLYFCFTGKDPRKVSKLMKAGWSVEISSKEKKKKFDAKIIFPSEDIMNNSNKAVDTSGGSTRLNMSGYKLRLSTVETKGFTTDNGTIPLQNKNAINIGIGSNGDQELVVEIAIPFKELSAENNFSLNEEVHLEVNVNALARDKYKAGSSNGISKDGGGGGNGGGGMHHGNGHSGGGGYAEMGHKWTADELSERSALYLPGSFKQKFRLSSPE